MLPLSFADQLNLEESELEQDEGSSGGVGSIFNTWSSTVPLVGQVAAFLDATEGPTPWGPEFPLDPGFTDLQPEPPPLLGRADFFKAFSVRFDEDHSSPSFTIEVR